MRESPDAEQFEERYEDANKEVEAAGRLSGGNGRQGHAALAGHGDELAILFNDPIGERAMKEGDHQPQRELCHFDG